MNEINLHCKYYDLNEFNERKASQNSNQRFSILHLNCRSVKQHFTDIIVLLESSRQKFDIIALSETWLCSHEHDMFSLEGYRSNFISRENRRGGGVGIFVSNKYSYKILNNLSKCTNLYNSNTTESIFLEIDCEKQKNIVVGCIYNPPGNSIEVFSDYISDITSCINSKISYICGDFNINLLNHDTNSNVSNFLNVFTSENLYPLITHPTRISSNTATLIDNIFTNVLNKNIHSGILMEDLSDHLPIFAVTQNVCSVKKEDQFIIKRIINQRKLELFKRDLKSISWENIYNLSDPNDQYHYFSELFSNLYDKHFPKQRFKVRPKRKPWLTNSLINCCRKKNTLYKMSVVKKDTASEKKYKSYKNKLTTILRQAEAQYYSEKLNSVKGDIKNTWMVLKNVINKNVSEISSHNSFTYRGSKVTNSDQIANIFNEYFVNVGPSLAKNIDIVNKDLVNYLSRNYPASMFLRETDENEIVNVIMKQKSNKACGYDDISIDDIEKILNSELQNLVTWFKANKVSLNIEKTNFILFQRKAEMFPNKNTDLYMDNFKINQIQYTKFLGVTVDSKLTWKNHIAEIENKISKNIGVISRASKFLKTKELQTLYCSLILPYLNYGVVLWGNNYQSNLNRIIKLQKRVIRITAKADHKHSTLPLFHNMGLLKFTDIVFKDTAIMMYKVANSQVPMRFTSMFKNFTSVHDHKTRQYNDFYFPKFKTNIKKFSFSVVGCKIWNSLFQ